MKKETKASLINREDLVSELKKIYRAQCALRYNGGVSCKYKPFTSKVMNLDEIHNSRINFNEFINRGVNPTQVDKLLKGMIDSADTRNYTINVNADTNTVIDGQHTLCAYILGVEKGFIEDKGMMFVFQQVGTDEKERDFICDINSTQKSWNLYDNVTSAREKNINIKRFLNDMVDPYFSNSNTTANLNFANTKGRMNQNDNIIRLAYSLGHVEIVSQPNKNNYEKCFASWTNENFAILRKQWTVVTRMWRFCDNLHRSVYGGFKTTSKSLAPKSTATLETFINQWKNSIFTDEKNIEKLENLKPAKVKQMTKGYQSFYESTHTVATGFRLSCLFQNLSNLIIE